MVVIYFVKIKIINSENRKTKNVEFYFSFYTRPRINDSKYFKIKYILKNQNTNETNED